MVHIPGLIAGIRKAIDADPGISEKALEDQFKKLILQPLTETKRAPPKALGLVVVRALIKSNQAKPSHSRPAWQAPADPIHIKPP